MHPASASEAKQLTNSKHGEADKNIRPLLSKVMTEIAPELAASKLTIPSGLINRAADKWHPLFAIADAAGGDWPKRVWQAACELEVEEEEQETSGISLLRRVVEATKEWPHDEIFSDELHDSLGGSNYSDKQRGRLLGAFGLKATRHRRGGKQARGYSIAAIREAESRYLKSDQDGRDA
jgi:hypothetical protein